MFESQSMIVSPEMNFITDTLFLASWCLFKSAASQNKNALVHLAGYIVLNT